MEQQHPEQPSLEAKKAYFDHFQSLPHSDDEGDDVMGTQQLSEDDGLDPREQRMRQRHRRFFRKMARARAAETEPAVSQRREEPSQARDDDVIFGTPEDMAGEDEVVVTSSARATPLPKVRKPVAPTATAKRARNVVDALLDKDDDDDDEVEIVGETPVDASKRQRAASAQPAPPVFKRLAAASRPRAASPSPLRTSTSTTTVSAAATATAAAAPKKRKRDPVTLRPDGEQIFKGLVFYYVPDNEIAPARRLRMQKAREYGATRTSDVTGATHVVVDRDIGYMDVEKAVVAGGRKAGVDGLVVVNDGWPVECVQFRALLDSAQKRYRLAGQPEEGKATEASEGENEDVQEEGQPTGMQRLDQLELKKPPRNAKRWDYVPLSTPESNEGGSSEPPAVVESQPIVLEAIHASAEVKKDEQNKSQEAEHVESGQRADNASDELTNFIDMMQEFKDLPLDNDDDEETASVAAAGDSQDSGSEEEQRQRKTQAANKASDNPRNPRFEERFACARSGGKDDHADNPNSRTIEILQSMLSYYERTSDQWRVMAYRKAITTLKRQPDRVTSRAEALRLPGVGPRLAAKIEEIATTDRLRRLEYAEKDGGDDVLKLFMGIYGVGPALAAQWAAKGMRTLEDVKTQVVKLTPAQKMGIERYEDLNTKIPREEVAALGEVVRDAARQVDADVELTIGGSYRRGAASSSDIDFIVTKPGTETEAELRPFLAAVVRRLQASGFLTATLAADGNIWHGCCVLPGGSVWRRIDFLLVPASQMGAALIYFTGDDIFNRSMRLLAQKKGMKLNQRGLYERPGGDGTGRGGGDWVVSEEDLVEGRDERRIFEILGVQWREPTQRWC